MQAWKFRHPPFIWPPHKSATKVYIQAFMVRTTRETSILYKPSELAVSGVARGLMNFLAWPVGKRLAHAELKHVQCTQNEGKQVTILLTLL